MFIVVYHHRVVSNDIPKLSPPWQERVRRAIAEKLRVKPEIFGKPLRRSLKGYRKLRVGDYRVIYRIEQGVVKVFVIQHRSAAYATVAKRI